MRSTLSDRQGHIAAWQSSGLSRPAYCKQSGLKYATFMSWFKKKAEKKSEGQFIALGTSATISQLRIHFPNGISLEYSGSLTKELLALLHHA